MTTRTRWRLAVAMAFVAGTGLGGAAGTVLAWQHAREIVEISAALLRREAKISQDDRAYRAERELDTLQALRGNGSAR